MAARKRGSWTCVASCCRASLLLLVGIAFVQLVLLYRGAELLQPVDADPGGRPGAASSGATAEGGGARSSTANSRGGGQTGSQRLGAGAAASAATAVDVASPTVAVPRAIAQIPASTTAPQEEQLRARKALGGLQVQAAAWANAAQGALDRVKGAAAEVLSRWQSQGDAGASASDAIEKEEQEEEEHQRCNDMHPNADSPDMLHVVFASDLTQVQGVQASIASILNHTSSPEEVTVHVLVQDRWAKEFKQHFGISEECSGTVSVSGVLIKLHVVDAHLIAKAVAKVAPNVIKERGAIDSVENFARFYMHLVLEGVIVIYLDADTIVQADLRVLRTKLMESNKTVGFVEREYTVQLSRFLREPSCLTVPKTGEVKKSVGEKAAGKSVDAQHRRLREATFDDAELPQLAEADFDDAPLRQLAEDNENEDEEEKKRKEKEKKALEIKKKEEKAKLDREMLAKLPLAQRAWLLNWRSLMRKKAYNVGILAVNLQRWKDLKISNRVEDFVKKHNDCGGKLWIGGSQPPLLLAFHDRPNKSQADFIVFPKTWNQGDLGWRGGMSTSGLKNKSILHWNGDRKPWTKKGLYKDIWRPHYERFFSVLKPYSDGEDVPNPSWKPLPEGEEQEDKPKPQKEASEEAGTPKLTVSKAGEGAPAPPPIAKEDSSRRRRETSPAELKAREECPSVLQFATAVNSKDEPTCSIGKNYGCTESLDKMWASGQCKGVFEVDHGLTVCGYGSASPRGAEADGVQPSGEVCMRGATAEPTARCGLMVLTSFFTTKKDWQRGKKAKPTTKKVRDLFRSSMALGINVTVVYDELPEEILTTLTTKTFRFHQVTFGAEEKLLGVNDVRYLFFQRLLKQHKEWSAVFMVDAFDVTLGMNLCPQLEPGTLYVGIERDKLRPNPWMLSRFKKLGSKYLSWYEKNVSATAKILNCGITGGSRSTMLAYFDAFVEILKDPKMASRKKGEEINANMAILNYLGYTKFKNKVKGNSPVHSKYKKYERTRDDVWFIHK